LEYVGNVWGLSKMKVLIVTPVFPPAIGGIEQHTFNLAKELNSMGLKASILTTGLGAKKFREKEEIQGIKVFRVKTGLKDNKDLAVKGSSMIFPLTKKIFELMKKENYDLLHAHCPFTLAACIPAKFYYGIPVIATIHGNWINCIKGRRYYEGRICTKKDYFNAKRCSMCLNQGTAKIKLKQFILRSLAENCNALIAVSSDVKKSIQLKKNVPIKVIPNVSSKIKCLSRKKARDSLNWKKEKKIILFIGAMLEEKGPELLVKAFPILLKKIKNSELRLVYGFSDRNYLSKIKEQTKKQKLQSLIHFHEKISNLEVRRKFIPASNVIVLPSLWPEPCSTIATEAMNAGTPLVVSRIGGFTDLIEEGRQGLFFRPGDYKELARKLIKLLKDKKLQESISINARKKIEKLNWHDVVKETLDLYKEVCCQNE